MTMEYEFPCQYPYCEFGFLEWNPVQAKCVPFFTDDCNLVVSASTASGKTAVAEAVMGYELARFETSKAVYVSPMKAIGCEKYGKWSRHATFGRYSPMQVSSDSSHTIDEYDGARLIVSTVESLAIRCRARDAWIRDAAVLVLDEAHLVGDGSRGAGCEAMVCAFTVLNPSARVLLLSGTMGNCAEMAKWLKSCNGKRTRFVSSTWRPSVLRKRVVEAESDAGVPEAVLREVAPGGPKTLVFVHSKSVGERLCRDLGARGVVSAFYHAGLSPAVRKRMLDDFRSGMAGLDTLVCTSSLGAGVTL